jgi:3-(3-hydroxy-phenyl)propionate hydroxylase
MDGFPPGFLLMFFGTASDMSPELRGAIQAARASGTPLYLSLIGPGAPQDITPRAEIDSQLYDTQGHIARQYAVAQAGAAYLFRPDQHVCARWLTLNAARLESALTRALGKPGVGNTALENSP